MLRVTLVSIGIFCVAVGCSTDDGVGANPAPGSDVMETSSSQADTDNDLGESPDAMSVDATSPDAGPDIFTPDAMLDDVPIEDVGNSPPLGLRGLGRTSMLYKVEAG